MNKSELLHAIQEKKSFLCVGLDPDLDKLPASLKSLSPADAVLAFCLDAIEASLPYCVAYKPNFAFFESLGPEGWQVLKQVIEAIPKSHFIIADAKRSDIGNTAKHYAVGVFDRLGADAITLNPYMGRDSIEPFLSFEGKWSIILGLTSNPGADDFQRLSMSGTPLYQHVMEEVASWGTTENLMFVVGATRAEMLKEIRACFPEHFFLIPGYGAQGGSLKEIVEANANRGGGIPLILVNSSRGILYGKETSDYKSAIKERAAAVASEMSLYI